MQLSAALHLPLGRSITLSAEAAEQLLGGAGLSVQLCNTVEAQRGLMLELLRRVASPNYDQRKELNTAPLLLEGEHPAWPLLALAQGGVLSSEQTAQALRRAVRLSSEARTPEPTLAHWLAGALLSVAESLLLGLWDVLLTYASLQRQATPHEGLSWLIHQLKQSPELLESPDKLCVQVLWAATYWLHGGEKLPSDPLAAQTRLLTILAGFPTLRQRTTTGPLPTPQALNQWMAHWLPALSEAERRTLAQQWQSLPPPDDHAYLSGITALRVPGQVALWRRSRNELHVVVLSSPAAPQPEAWQWRV